MRFHVPGSHVPWFHAGAPSCVVPVRTHEGRWIVHRGDLWALFRVVEQEVRLPSRVTAMRRRRQDLRIRDERPKAELRRWWNV